MAVRECSWLQEHLFHGDGIFILVLRWDKCIGVLRDCVRWFIRATCDAQCSPQVPPPPPPPHQHTVKIDSVLKPLSRIPNKVATE